MNNEKSTGDVETKVVKPITPAQAHKQKAKAPGIPDFVIEAFNELIAEKFDGKEARITITEATQRIKKKEFEYHGHDRLLLESFNKEWLNVEEVYRKNGWKVEYDKPGYNESYTGYYIFRSPTVRG